MKIAKYIFLFLYIFSFGYHCFSSLQNGQASSEMSSKVTDVVIEIEEDVFNIEVTDYEKAYTNVRKLIGHFGYFGLIGVFGFICIYLFCLSLNKTLLFSNIIGLSMSFISEGLQLLSLDRGPSVKDAFIDFSGYLLAGLIVFLVIFTINKKEKNKKAN